MTKLKEGVAWDFTSVDDYSGYLQGHVVLDQETVDTLGPLNEGTAYVAALQILYATVVTNYGREWTNDMLEVTVVEEPSGEHSVESMQTRAKEALSSGD